jgi:N-acetylglucosaminyldiphosphoundecaprenol N-acetyl-beta-D-mannosaminyltransferase
VPERVSGSDLAFPLLGRAARRGWRTYLLGGAPGVAEEAARRLRARLPSLVVAGTDAPRITLEPGDPEGEAALARLRAARPDLVLVALGAPKQELWIHRHRAALGPAVAVGVGATLDFLSGRVRRAPRWVSRAGLEWLWRLGREPRRLWRRYLVQDPAFAAILWRELRARPSTPPR